METLVLFSMFGCFNSMYSWPLDAERVKIQLKRSQQIIYWISCSLSGRFKFLEPSLNPFPVSQPMVGFYFSRQNWANRKLPCVSQLTSHHVEFLYIMRKSSFESQSTTGLNPVHTLSWASAVLTAVCHVLSVITSCYGFTSHSEFI